MKNSKSIFKKLTDDHNDFLEDYIRGKLPSFHYKRHIKLKINNNNTISNYKLSNEFDKEIINYFLENTRRKISTDWHRAYIATNNIKSLNYIPEDMFYKDILPKVNRLDLLHAYEDKNNYNNLFSEVLTPETILRNINGNFYDSNYLLVSKLEAIKLFDSNKAESVVIKPTIRSGGGKEVKVISKEEIKDLKPAEFINKLIFLYEKDFIIQAFQKQHDLLNEIYPHSLNTLRIMTYKNKNEIEFLSSIIRMGNAGSKVDNATLGGITCGIQLDGKLNSFATEHKAFEKYNQHPYTGFVFEGATIPNYKAVKKFVIELHSKLFYFQLASWDISINQLGEPVLIEVNLGYQDLNFHQRNNGPIFGEKTIEILNNVYGVQLSE